MFAHIFCFYPLPALKKNTAHVGECLPFSLGKLHLQRQSVTLLPLLQCFIEQALFEKILTLLFQFAYFLYCFRRLGNFKIGNLLYRINRLFRRRRVSLSTGRALGAGTASDTTRDQ